MLPKTSDQRGPSHPPAATRLLLLAGDCFGGKAVAALAAGVVDRRKYAAFEREVGNITVTDLLRSRDVNHCFVH